MRIALGRARAWAGRALVGCVVAAVLPSIAAAAPAALSRYAAAGDHWVTTGAVTSAYRLESTLGFLAPYPTPGTVPLYGCLAGADHFLSLDAACEGQTVLGTEGWIYSAAPAGEASSPVYLCLVATPSSEDHFASASANCEGQITLGRLGYALASAPLNRYNGGVHWVTTGSVSSGFSLEGTLGYLVTGGAGTSPLYGCVTGSDHFLSLSLGCEGTTTLGVEGWIYASAPADVASDAVYRCRTASDHFAAISPDCEGQVTEGRLGYALQAAVPVPPVAPAAPQPVAPAAPQPVATSIPQPLAPGRHHRGRAMHVKITFSWTWRRGSTSLRSAQIGRLPKGGTIRITCHGRGRGCTPSTMTARAGRVRRLTRSLTGRVYRAGDRLLVTVSARGYQAERAEVRIRYGKLPTVSLL